MKQPAVYILSSQRNGTLYLGVTSDLIKRIWEHKNNVVKGFSFKYGCHDLVCYEILETVEGAIIREKQIKKWNREWKLNLVEAMNPEWSDFYCSLI